MLLVTLAYMLAAPWITRSVSPPARTARLSALKLGGEAGSVRVKSRCSQTGRRGACSTCHPDPQRMCVRPLCLRGGTEFAVGAPSDVGAPGYFLGDGLDKETKVSAL